MRGGSIAAGVALLALAAGPAQAATQRILYVGDSLGVGTTPGFAHALGAAATVRGDSRVGRPSPEGLSVLRQEFTPADDVVVFDLGTNDDPARPAQLASDLAAARQATGARCMIVATLNRPPLNGVSVDGLNAAVEQFASGAPNVQLVDWHAEAQANPSLLGPDHVHPTPQGYALRAQLFAEALTQCGSRTLASPPRRTAPKRVRPVPPRARPKPKIKVPGIESSGISFSEPLKVGGKDVQLLLPNTKPPYPAVVLTGAPDADAQKLAAAGVTALEFTRAGTAADIRAAVALLRRRKDTERGSVGALGVGGAADALAAAAAGSSLRAVVAIDVAPLPAIELRDWRIRRALDAPAQPVTNWLRVRARADVKLRQDPAAAWQHVSQPILATWVSGGAIPNRASAVALAAALSSSPNRDRTFTTAATQSAAADAAIRWLKRKLRRGASGTAITPLPPPSRGPQPVEITDASVIYAPPIQIGWLAIPALILAASALRSRPARALIVAACGAAAACAAVIAAGVAIALHSRGGSPAAVVGLPWPFALGFVLAAALGAVTIALVRRRALVAAAASTAWLALALFWLL